MMLRLRNLSFILLSFTILLVSFISVKKVSAQITVSGIVADAINKKALPFVNIGIRHKNLGTISAKDGRFSLAIPATNENDSLLFSIVGYEELSLPIKSIVASAQTVFALKPKIVELSGVSVNSSKRIEKKIGITSTRALMHFVDASIHQNDIFEIAQVVEPSEDSNALSKITGVDLLIADKREDSGIFRINFYAFDNGRPGSKIVDRNIIQTKAIAPGFLHFDLKPYNINLKGKFVIGLEFIPSSKISEQPIRYEVKMGGQMRSFVRSHSQADWRVPPHYYKLFVTALVNPYAKKNDAEEIEEKETKPALRMFSQKVNDSFSVFVRLPKDYYKNRKQKYPVVFLLDANAYFDIAGDAVGDIEKLKPAVDPILVGIGYKNFIENDSLRNRDYTYPVAPEADSFAISGGADKFLSFIITELIPVISKNYKCDTAEFTLMGHSLGGYFALFALQQELETGNHYFHRYIAASPSLHYGDYYLVRRLMAQTIPAWSVPADVFITMGSAENTEDGGTDSALSDRFNTFIKDLAKKWSDVIKVKAEIYPGLYHMETAVRTFTDGLKIIMKTEGKNDLPVKQ